MIHGCDTVLITHTIIGTTVFFIDVISLFPVFVYTLPYRPQQHWSLMPLHGIYSCVQPAYYCHGPSSASGFQGGGFGFPAWFGKNSTQGKLSRLMGEVQYRMRLKVSGDRKEVLMSYLPVLYPKLVDPLMESAAEVDGVIELMDDYYLSKDEWDGLNEVMAIGRSPEDVLKKIPSATKSAFTRKSVQNACPHFNLGRWESDVHLIDNFLRHYCS